MRQQKSKLARMHTTFSLIIFRTARSNTENFWEERSLEAIFLRKNYIWMLSSFFLFFFFFCVFFFRPRAWAQKEVFCARIHKTLLISARSHNPLVSCITFWFYYLAWTKNKFSKHQIWITLYYFYVFKQTWTRAPVLWRRFSNSVCLNEAVFICKLNKSALE